MRSLEEAPRIAVGGHNINNLRYAGGTVLVESCVMGWKGVIGWKVEPFQQL